MIQSKGTIKRGLMADTGLKYGPAKILIVIPNRPDVIPEEVLKSFVHDFTTALARAQQPTVYDIYEEAQKRLN